VIQWRSPICLVDRMGLRVHVISKFNFNNTKAL
jgi:hypothetical protein